MLKIENGMIEYRTTIRSRHLGNERSIWIQPPRDNPCQNLVIFLDAELYRDRVGATDTVRRLSESGSIADSWYVYVSTCSAEARWIECPCYLPFAQFVGDELLPWLTALQPELAAITSRTVIGLSYTGLAAAYLAREMRGAFNRVIAQSGSFWWRDCWLADAYESGPAPDETKFYLEVGTREVQQNIRHREDVLQVISQIEGVRRFRDVLIRRGISVDYIETDGAHDFESWKKSLPKALVWALGA